MAYARTLMDDVAALHPTWERFILLIDEPDGHFRPADERFTVIPFEAMGIANPKEFLFRHTPYEICAATRPHFLKWMLTEQKVDRLFYFDCDSRVYAPLSAALEAMDERAGILVTPHLTRPAPSLTDNEELCLRCGCINAGFLAIRPCPEVMRVLDWWDSRCQAACYVDLPRGLFLEQKWLDLAPGMFDGLVYWRDEAYNVGTWNLATRKVTRVGDRWEVNGRPLVQFHFSGMDASNLELLSKHVPNVFLKDLPVIQEMAVQYVQALEARGLKECMSWGYAYGRFADGQPIATQMRASYRRDAEARRRYGLDPFQWQGGDFLKPWPAESKDGLVTLLMHDVWASRLDLQKVFPDIAVADRLRFATWWVTDARRDLDLPACYWEPLAIAPQSRRWTRHVPRVIRKPVGRFLRRMLGMPL